MDKHTTFCLQKQHKHKHMALEIEHKFLLKNNDWQKDIKKSTTYKQGYLISDCKNNAGNRLS